MNYLTRWTTLMKGMGQHCPLRKLAMGMMFLMAVGAMMLVMRAPPAPLFDPAELRARHAEDTLANVLKILNGEVMMVDSVGGQYAQRSVCKWELVEEIKK